MVWALRAELGTSQGTVKRVVQQLHPDGPEIETVLDEEHAGSVVRAPSPRDKDDPRRASVSQGPRRERPPGNAPGHTVSM